MFRYMNTDERIPIDKNDPKSTPIKHKQRGEWDKRSIKNNEMRLKVPDKRIETYFVIYTNTHIQTRTTMMNKPFVYYIFALNRQIGVLHFFGLFHMQTILNREK